MSILFSEVYKNCMEWIQSVWAILSKQKQTDMYIKCLFLYQFKKKAYIYIQVNLVISKFTGPLQNFELSEIRLKGSKGLCLIGNTVRKFGQKWMQTIVVSHYNILIIICTYCVYFSHVRKYWFFKNK